MKSIYNVEYKVGRGSLFHWEPGIEAENRTQAGNIVRTMYGSGTNIGQVRFIGMPGPRRTREEIIQDAYEAAA